MADLDRFMKESSKSYKECKVKNSARRNSLMKKTLSIEVERKMATAELSREEKQLREQLKTMQIERTKTSIISSMRERSNSRSKSKRSVQECDDRKKHGPSDALDPYPVTFGRHTPIIRSRANTLDEKGKAFAARRGRRESKEFEDLHVNTATGTLALSRLQALALGSAMSPSSPNSLSPSTPRRRFDSSSSVDSGGAGEGGHHWVGDPEAIGSVRRPRKSVEEQEWDKLARKEARLYHCH